MQEKREYVRLNVNAQATYTIKGKDVSPNVVTFQDVSGEGLRGYK